MIIMMIMIHHWGGEQANECGKWLLVPGSPHWVALAHRGAMPQSKVKSVPSRTLGLACCSQGGGPVITCRSASKRAKKQL